MTVEELHAVLSETPSRLTSLTATSTAAQLRLSPGFGKWSVTEVLAHLRSCSDVWGDAMEAILTHDHPTLKAVSPVRWIKSTNYFELDFATSFRSFTRQRMGLLAVLSQLSPDDWSRSATVTGGGRPIELTVRDYASRMARHERSHWRQIERTVAAVRS